MNSYVYTKDVIASVDQVLQKLRSKLDNSGFSILNQIEIGDILNEKLGLEYHRYVVLSIWNAVKMQQALEIQENIGLFMPFTIVVYESLNGSVISMAKPTLVFNLIDDRDLREIAHFIESKVTEVIDTLLL